MKKTLFLLLPLAALLWSACSNDETYADQRKRENGAIRQYLNDSSVTVISERQFFDQDTMTDVSKNEFVLLESSGIYLQIVEKGCGEKIKDGETATVLCRFTERNLLTDSIIATNNILYFSALVDKMSVTNTSGTFTASFDPTSSVMYQVYGRSSGSTQVPNGWLSPLPYIKGGQAALGRRPHRPRAHHRTLHRGHLCGHDVGLSVSLRYHLRARKITCNYKTKEKI